MNDTALSPEAGVPLQSLDIPQTITFSWDVQRLQGRRRLQGRVTGPLVFTRGSRTATPAPIKAEVTGEKSS